LLLLKKFGVDKFIISILTNNVGITRVFYEIFRT